VFGWLRLERGPWRTRWAVIGAVLIAVFVVFGPNQAGRISDLRAAMQTQSEILADLHAISDEIPCRPIAVPNHRPIPHVALWTGVPPEQIVSAQLAQPRRGAYIDPADDRVRRNFTLDPRDPKTLTAKVPDGFTRVAANRSWVLYARCA
jgi:hypothetical protein